MEQKEIREIVKYDNQFNLTDINDLSTTEQDVFFTILSAFTKSRSLQQTIDLGLLRTSAGMSFQESGKGGGVFRKNLISTSGKIMKILFVGNRGEEVVLVTLFKLFKIDFEKGTLIAVLNDEFAHYFYDVPETIAFTWFELEAFLQMRSKYSKALFRRLRQYFRGTWEVSVEELRKVMGFPKVWTASQMLRQIRTKVIPEIEKTRTYSDITCEPVHAHAKGRPIEKFIFTYKCTMDIGRLSENFTSKGFEPVLVTKTIEHQEMKPNYTTGQPEITTTTEVVEEPEKCPNCGADVIRRKDKEGKTFRCCMNSNYWNLGNKSCNWMEYE